MQICFATMEFAVEDRYLIKSCETAKVTCMCNMFSEKTWNVN